MIHWLNSYSNSVNVKIWLQKGFWKYKVVKEILHFMGFTDSWLKNLNVLNLLKLQSKLNGLPEFNFPSKIFTQFHSVSLVCHRMGDWRRKNQKNAKFLCWWCSFFSQRHCYQNTWKLYIWFLLSWDKWLSYDINKGKPLSWSNVQSNDRRT